MGARFIIETSSGQLPIFESVKIEFLKIDLGNETEQHIMHVWIDDIWQFVRMLKESNYEFRVYYNEGRRLPHFPKWLDPRYIEIRDAKLGRKNVTIIED